MFINIEINQLENLMEGRSLSVPMMVQDTQVQDLVLIFLATTGTTTSKHVKAKKQTMWVMYQVSCRYDLH